jgi:hypothetical protein
LQHPFNVYQFFELILKGFSPDDQFINETFILTIMEEQSESQPTGISLIVSDSFSDSLRKYFNRTRTHGNRRIVHAPCILVILSFIFAFLILQVHLGV